MLVTSEASPGYAQTKASPARLQPGIPRLPSRSPGCQSIRGRCAQGRTLHPSKVTPSDVAGAEGAFVQGCERFAASCRLPLARRQLRPLSSSQPVTRRYFLSPARSCQRLGCLKTVNYAAFVCGVGRWGQGRPKSTAPCRNPRLSIGWEGTFPRASPAAEAEMVFLMAHHRFKNKTGGKHTNKQMAAMASSLRSRGKGGGNDVLRTHLAAPRPATPYGLSRGPGGRCGRAETAPGTLAGPREERRSSQWCTAVTLTWRTSGGSAVA